MKRITSIILMIAMLMSMVVFAEEIVPEDINNLASSVTKIAVVISNNPDANSKSRNVYNGNSTEIYLPQNETVTLAVSFEGITMDGYKAVYEDNGNYVEFGNFTSLSIENENQYADKRMDVYLQNTSDNSVARVGSLTIYSFRDKLGHLTVNNPDGTTPYNGRVNYTVLDGFTTLYNYSTEAIDGNMVFFLPENAASKSISIVAYPEKSDYANTQVTPLTISDDAGVRYSCGKVSFQTPVTTITMKDGSGNNVNNLMVAYIVDDTNGTNVRIGTYPNDKLHLASLGDLYNSNANVFVSRFVSGGIEDLKTESVGFATPSNLEWTLAIGGDSGDGGTPAEKQLYEKVASVTPVSKTGEEVTPGSKFYTCETKRTLYLPVPIGTEATTKLELVFKDENGDILDLGDTVVDMRFRDGHASEPVYNKETNEITVYPVSGGYADQFWGDIYFDENEVSVKLHIVVYKGKLGELNVSSPEGTYEGDVNYLVGYKGSNNSGGSNTNAYAYNGILPIPVMNNLMNVEYAYVLLWPGQKVNGKVYANAEYKDFTNVMGNSELIFDMGSAIFQEARYTATVVDESDAPWDDLVFGVQSNYSGQEYNIFEASVHSIGGVGNIAAFASFGADFSNSLTIKFFQYNSPEKIDKVVDITDVKTETVVYTADPLRIQGDILTPQGEKIPVGDGRDVHITIDDLTENSDAETIQYNINTGSYETSELVNNHKYRIQISPDMGDFDDLYLTDAPWIELTYRETPDTYDDGVNEFGEAFSYTVDENGLITLDIKVTEAFLKGQVLLGGVGTTDHIDVQLMKDGQVIADASTHTSTVPGDSVNKSGVFVMGGEIVADGDYQLVIGEPKTSLQHAGTTIDITLPMTDLKAIELPENKVYGKMVVLSEHEAKYENKFRRTYVNIYNEYGEYITNGRVREDGLFGVSSLETGRYYAQAFVTPYAELAEDYASSERVAFVVDNSGQSNFDVPLIRKIATGNVTLPNSQPLVKGWVLVYDASGDMVYSASTDDNGNYVLAALPDGNYKVKALGDDTYYDSPMNSFVISNDSINNESALDLTLTNVQVTGTLTKNDASNVDVIVYDENKNFVTSVKTSAETYNLGGLLSGNYYIQAVPNASASDTSSEMIEFEYSSSEMTQDITLGTSDVSGTVKLPNGDVQQNGWVKLFKDGLVIATSQVHTDGSFKFGNLEEGVTYQVQADATKGYYESEKIDVTKDMTGIEIVLRSEASIKGSISLNNKLLDLQKIYVYKDKSPIATMTTNAFGEFSVCDLESGTYEFVVVVDGQSYVFTKTYSGTEVDAGQVSLR